MDLRTAPGVYLTRPSEDHKIVYMSIRDLREADHNPKLHDDNAVRASISRFGYVAPMIIDGRTGHLVAGHGRLTALLGMRAAGENPPAGIRTDPTGQWLAPVVNGWSSCSDSEASAYLIADNQLTTNGGWDNEALRELLNDIGAQDPELVELTGVDVDALAALIADGLPDVDEPDPGPSAQVGGWVMVRVEVPPHVAAAWRSHAEMFGDGRDCEATALASLLGVVLDP
jgi:hypothetical protein